MLSKIGGFLSVPSGAAFIQAFNGISSTELHIDYISSKVGIKINPRVAVEVVMVILWKFLRKQNIKLYPLFQASSK